MDITFKTGEGRFNYRVCGLILGGGKILAMHDERSPYYYLPGGRVRLHETAEAAMLREIREELGAEAKIVRPLWLNQGFFTEEVSGEKYHEVCIYFLLDLSETGILSKGDRFALEEEGRRHVFEWLAFERLEKEYFHPSFLKKRIYQLPDQFTILSNYD